MGRVYEDSLILTGKSAAIFVSLLCCCIATSLVLAAPAALTKDATAAEEQLLVRTKRADEVSVGNHQNEAHLEKKTLDLNEQPAAHDLTKREADDTSIDVIQEEKEEEAGPGNASDNDNTNESENLGLDEGTEGGQSEEQEQAAAPDDDDETREDNSMSRRKREAEKAGKFASSKQTLVTHDSKTHLLKRRSVSSPNTMIAENMGGASYRGRADRHMRSKRDLSYEELRELMKEEPEYFDQPEEEILNHGKYFEPQYDDGGEEFDEEKRNAYDEEEEEDEDQDEFLSASKEEAIEKEILRYEDVRKLLKLKEEEETKESIIDYLLEAAEERLREAVEEEREVDLREREAELYHNSRLEKRYPYSYEPYGGRWEALVPGAKRSGRQSYENLYRLAQALNDNENYLENDYEEEEEKKKK